MGLWLRRGSGRTWGLSRRNVYLRSMEGECFMLNLRMRIAIKVPISEASRRGNESEAESRQF